MARKNIVKPYQVVTSGDMSSDVTSDATNIQFLDAVAYQLIWTGTPTGSFSVQGTVDGTNWDDLTLSTNISAAGSGDTALVSLSDLPFKQIRVKYTASSGSGTLDVHVMAKQVGG